MKSPFFLFEQEASTTVLRETLAAVCSHALLVLEAGRPRPLLVIDRLLDLQQHLTEVSLRVGLALVAISWAALRQQLPNRLAHALQIVRRSQLLLKRRLQRDVLLLQFG